MSPNTVSSSRIAHIEFHDARLSSIHVQPEGVAELVFDSLNVYRELAPEQYEVWEYHAVLRIEGVSGLEVDGAWMPDTAVMTASVDGKEETIDGLGLLSSRAIHQFELNLFGGTTLRLIATSMRMTIGKASRFLETWTGPLVSGKPS